MDTYSSVRLKDEFGDPPPINVITDHHCSIAIQFITGYNVYTHITCKHFQKAININAGVTL